MLNLLLITEKGKSHYILLKILTDECFQKQNNDRKHFCMPCLQDFSTKEILNNHRKQCLLIRNNKIYKLQ